MSIDKTIAKLHYESAVNRLKDLQALELEADENDLEFIRLEIESVRDEIAEWETELKPTRLYISPDKYFQKAGKMPLVLTPRKKRV